MKNNKEKFNSNTLSEIAHKEIKRLIIEGELKAGDKIIQENIARDFGISRIPIIQALSALHNEGLLEKVPRKGFYVKKISKKQLKDLLEMKLLLEEFGVKKLIENLNEENIEKLNEYLNKFKKHKDKDRKKYSLIDADFHYYLIESSGNEMILKFVNSLNILLLSTLHEIRVDNNESYSDHVKIVKGIIEKNCEQAVLSLRDNTNRVKAYV